MHRMLLSGIAVYVATCSLAIGQTVQPGQTRSEVRRIDPTRPNGVIGTIADPAPPDPAMAVIAPSARAFVEAFNRNDAKAVAGMWASDGEYVDAAGKRFAGREAVEKEYAGFFAANPKARISFVVDNVRQLDQNTLIEEGRTLVKAGEAESAGRYRVVHKRVDGKWLMASVRDSSLNALGEAALGDLGWLVGDWVADENGVKMESTCRWTASRKFLERKYTVSRGGKVVASGVQMIGWNPQLQQLQSWVFTSDGGHAVGNWTPRKDGWAIETQGMLADGTPTQAVNLFTRIDDQAFSWQSVERAVGGSALPDTEEVLLKRVAAQPAAEKSN